MSSSHCRCVQLLAARGCIPHTADYHLSSSRSTHTHFFVNQHVAVGARSLHHGTHTSCDCGLCMHNNTCVHSRAPPPPPLPDPMCMCTPVLGRGDVPVCVRLRDGRSAQCTATFLTGVTSCPSWATLTWGSRWRSMPGVRAERVRLLACAGPWSAHQGPCRQPVMAALSPDQYCH